MKRIATLAALLIAGAAQSTLNPTYMNTGKIAGVLLGEAAGTQGFTGNFTFSLAGLPVGAVTLQAYLYASEFVFIPNATATFANTNLGNASAYSTDNTFWTYRWNVTNLVNGNAQYGAFIQGPMQLYGSALAVVYTHPTLPMATVGINDGAHELGENANTESGNTQFAGWQPGSGRLSVFTVGDDPAASGETVDFNSVNVGGPLNGNLGSHASLLNMGVNIQAGSNTVQMTTRGDWLGWQVAMLQVVPEPATLCALGLGALAMMRRKRA